MSRAFIKALTLIISGDPELLNILGTTARVCLTSSVIALIIGVPLGILYGACRFKGRSILIVLNRTLMSVPPVVCGLIFFLLCSGVGPLRAFKLIFTVRLMIIAQVVLITPLVAALIESHVSGIAEAILDTTKGVGLGRGKAFLLILKESVYQIFTAYLFSYARAIAEVGAVSMVGGAIAWKTNVMTTAIMQYTNKGDFSMGIALGIILLTISLVVNIIVTVVQRRMSK